MANIVKWETNMPLRAIPEEKLNTMLVEGFMDWISGLLSLTDETSADRLINAMPAIKEHCWSMGFVEIKKMFEMYADSKLDVKPISNFFDRVQVGKIAEAYRNQKKSNQKLGRVMEIENELIISAWNHWKVMRNLKLKHTEVFDQLYHKGVFKPEDELMPPNKKGEQKPWKVWYDNLELKARPWAVAWAIDQKLDAKERNEARNGTHPLNKKLMKLKALEYFFSKYETENRLIDKLKTL